MVQRRFCRYWKAYWAIMVKNQHFYFISYQISGARGGAVG
jgi:hypothetical protein